MIRYPRQAPFLMSLALAASMAAGQAPSEGCGPHLPYPILAGDASRDRGVELLGLAAGRALPGARPPNVVLVVVDDLGWTDLACYGSQYYETPNLDRLAREGLRFTNAYAAAAVCSPTRAAVLTGRSPARLGLTDWIRARFQGGTLPEDGQNPSGYVAATAPRLSCPRNPLWLEHEEITVAEALGPEGYVAAHIGKWHLGMDAWYPEHQGFQLNRGGCDFGQPPSYFDPYVREGQGGIPTLAPRRPGEYLTDREADEAVAFVRANAQQPFFLYLAHYAVHAPIQAPAELVEHYRRKPVTNHRRADYAAMVQKVDAALGRLMAVLAELELTARTLVIFTSDNGGLLGPTDNAPLRAGKGWPYEGGLRVPLIVHWTGMVPRGRVSNEPVTSVDYFPTILEAAGVEPPSDRALDGLSLLAHFRSGGQQGLGDRPLVWHFPHYRSAEIGPFSAIRHGRWKLVKWWEGARLELYDLQSDPGESTEVGDLRPERRAALDRELRKHLEAVGARLPR